VFFIDIPLNNIVFFHQSVHVFEVAYGNGIYNDALLPHTFNNPLYKKP
jgi:hypothetical protein